MSLTRRIALSVEGDITVSTIQLLPPIGSHYETVVFNDSKEPVTQEEQRYGTEEEALAGHTSLCKKYNLSSKLMCPETPDEKGAAK